MSSAATKRVQKELAELMANPIQNVYVEPSESNVLQWKVVMIGPAGTPYEGGKFGLDVVFGHDFPFKAPKITFTNKMYHPNIDSDGSICIGILKADVWKPNTRMPAVLLSLYNLLESPNPDDPLVASIADQYRADYGAFVAKAREYTKKYAV